MREDIGEMGLGNKRGRLRDMGNPRLSQGL